MPPPVDECNILTQQSMQNYCSKPNVEVQPEHIVNTQISVNYADVQFDEGEEHHVGEEKENVGEEEENGVEE